MYVYVTMLTLLSNNENATRRGHRGGPRRGVPGPPGRRGPAHLQAPAEHGVYIYIYIYIYNII